ncbi:MAG: hypothetical protein F6K35_51020 [Okeania sp. SIO2H7]|nr:hypothetical protein [Okeania sp. SIO2H7]
MLSGAVSIERSLSVVAPHGLFGKMWFYSSSLDRRSSIESQLRNPVCNTFAKMPSHR